MGVGLHGKDTACSQQPAQRRTSRSASRPLLLFATPTLPNTTAVGKQDLARRDFVARQGPALCYRSPHGSTFASRLSAVLTSVGTCFHAISTIQSLLANVLACKRKMYGRGFRRWQLRLSVLATPTSHHAVQRERHRM